MKPGNRTLAWIFLFIAVAAALLVAVALWPTGADKWKAMSDRVDKLKMEARSRKLPRSPLRGKLVPGNAWDEYNIALKDAQTWADDQNGGLFGRFVNDDKSVDRAKVEQLVESHVKAIEHLRLGAQRSDGQYPYNWERGAQMEIPSLLGSRRLANDAIAQARIWTEKGRGQDAADLILDVTVFGRDLSTNGTLLSSLIGYALYTISFDELRHLMLSGKLTQKQLADLAQKLEVVDRDFPSLGPAYTNETIFLGTVLVDGLPSSEWLTFLKRGELRVALNPRSTMAEAFEMREGYLQRVMKLDQMNYKAAKAEAQAITTEGENSPNALVRLSMPSVSRPLTVHREALAHLRVLRAGATVLATGKMPTIPDPFGENLLHKQEGTKSKIWSIGSDGINQQGAGNWEGKPDIVFEIGK